MFNKFSNKSLLIVFGVLAIIVAAMFLFDAGKTERTFKSELISIDTTKVTKVVIYPKAPKDEPIRIVKSGDEWKVELKDGKLVPGSDSRIKSVFTQLLTINPTRLAARGENRFAEFQIDSSAAHVQVFEGSSMIADLVLGKFSMDQATRQMASFVRLAGDDNIYEVKGFLSLSHDSDASIFRNKKIVEGGYTDWNSVRFEYPGDSSFVMNKISDVWQINGTPTDSAETVKFLRALSNLSGTKFVDDANPDDLMNPAYKVTIEKEQGEINIEGYISGDALYVRSTLNPESIFNGNEGKLKEKLFISPDKLKK